MMWWAIWCAVAVVAGGACAEAGPSTNTLAQPIDWAQLESSMPDDESLSYAVPPMGGRYAAGAPWLYLLAEVPRDTQVRNNEKLVRSRRTLYVSVNPAVEVLQRGAYNSYLERQAHANRDFLNCVGKRDWNPSVEVEKYISN